MQRLAPAQPCTLPSGLQVYILENVDPQLLKDQFLYASDNLAAIVPSDNELAAAGVTISDPALPNSTVWLGCVVAPRALMDGEVLAVLPGVGSAEACSRQCREYKEGPAPCNVFNMCTQDGGCSYSDQFVTVRLQQDDCECSRPLPQRAWLPAHRGANRLRAPFAACPRACRRAAAPAACGAGARLEPAPAYRHRQG